MISQFKVEDFFAVILSKDSFSPEQFTKNIQKLVKKFD